MKFSDKLWGTGLATVPVVLVAPHRFAHPKLFCFLVAVWAMWRHVDRPDTPRVPWLGAATTDVRSFSE